MIDYISKLYNIEIINFNNENRKYAPALVIDNDLYYEIKSMNLEEIKNIIVKMQEA